MGWSLSLVNPLLSTGSRPGTWEFLNFGMRTDNVSMVVWILIAVIVVNEDQQVWIC